MSRQIGFNTEQTRTDLMELRIKYMKIPSESRGYTVWLSWGRSGYLIGTVRPYGNKKWEATFDDGRGPNSRSGDKMVFFTRTHAADWLEEVSKKRG